MCDIRSFWIKASLCGSQFPAATVVFSLYLVYFLSLGNVCIEGVCYGAYLMREGLYHFISQKKSRGHGPRLIHVFIFQDFSSLSSTAWWRRVWGNSGESTSAVDGSAWMSILVRFIIYLGNSMFSICCVSCLEWSNSASVGGLAKPRSNPPRVSFPSVHSVQSSSTDTTSTSSDSTQKDMAYKRPILGEKSQTWQNLLK